MDVYVKSGAAAVTAINEPTKFANDMQFNKQTRFTLSSKMFPTLRNFVIAVRVDGMDLYTNVFNVH